MFGTHDRTERAAKQKRQMLVVFVCNALILLMNRRPNRADGEFIKSSEDPCSAHQKMAETLGFRPFYFQSVKHKKSVRYWTDFLVLFTGLLF